MATVQHARELNTVNLTDSEVREADEVTREFKDVDVDELRIRIETTDGKAVQLPQGLVRLLRLVLRLASSGEPITLGQSPKVLTSVEAAKSLGISRPTLLKMAADDQIPSHKVGSHTRFLREDVRKALELRASERRSAFNELRAFEDALGLDDGVSR